MYKKNILFLTGTRADFGKLKPLIQKIEDHENFNCIVFCTGMHQLKLYGHTAEEVNKCGYQNVHHYINQRAGDPMEVILANTIQGLSRFLEENFVDLIIIHGDRVEALAGAIVGIMKNILVGHIEGGEKSGTVDEMIRHAVSKLSHLHFVANNEAQQRVLQLGENAKSIFIIGSPDIDVMCSSNLPNLDTVKKHYGIEFENFAVAMFHPVTTEYDKMEQYSEQFVQALEKSGDNFVLIYPNNDEGTNYILNGYKKLKNNPKIRIFPSIKFESFLVLLKNAQYCIGNSSAGMREAPFYGIPTVNIGSRQQNRFNHQSIINTSYDTSEILTAINKANESEKFVRSQYFGDGDSAEKFIEVLSSAECWNIPSQKIFYDIPKIGKDRIQ